MGHAACSRTSQEVTRPAGNDMRVAESNPNLQLHSNPGWHQEIQVNIQEKLVKMSQSTRERMISNQFSS